MTCSHKGCNEPIFGGAHFADGTIRGMCGDHLGQHELNAELKDRANRRIASAQRAVDEAIREENRASANLRSAQEALVEAIEERRKLGR